MDADPTNPADDSTRLEARLFLALAAVLSLVVGWTFSAGVDDSRAWGWDESMHAGLPAERFALALEAGDGGAFFDVIHGSMQYPFAWPLVVGTAHALASDAGAAVEPGEDGTPGPGLEHLGRRLGRWSLGFMMFGLALLARECWRGTRPPLGLVLAPLLVLGSPLLVDYSGTWFLEAPFATVATWALVLWLVRARRLAAAGTSAWWLDLLTGAVVIAAFFTKFNYGLLLGLGLFLDLFVDLVATLRDPARPTRSFLLATARLALVPALGFLWWFVLPLPLGAEIAAAHREAFAAFLGGNQHLAATPWAHRLLHWTTSFVATPRLLILVLVGLALTLVFCLRQVPQGCASARAQVRLWLVLIAMALPIATHNFHLDRFLVVLAPPVFVLATVGLVSLAQALIGRRFGFENARTRRAPLLVLPVLLGLCLAGRSLDGVPAWGATVGWDERPEVRAYQERVLRERWCAGYDRKLSTAGLDRDVHDRVLDLVGAELETLAGELGRTPTFAWLGISTELAPAALHIGLHERHGTPARLRRDAGTVRGDGNPAMVLSFEDADPGWSDEQLFAWADGFDVVLTANPPDLKGRGSREFVRPYQNRLRNSGRVVAVELGSVEVAKGLGTQEVDIYALCKP